MAINQQLYSYGSLRSGGREPIPDPFFDYASLAMPETIDTALLLCEFLLSQNGVYMSALERVVGFFNTDLKIDGASREEKTRYKDFLYDTLGITQIIRDVALDFLCFHGDTVVPTCDGVFKIRDLVGKTVDVISLGGVYRRAKFKKFGRQQLMEVTFADGRKVLATPEHQWVVQKSTGGYVKVPTTQLAGRRIERTVAPRPEKNEDFREGVRHGFTFGDGSLYNKYCPRRVTKAAANFYGDKDKALLPFFAGHGTPPKKQRADSDRYSSDRYKIHGLPAHYKELPANDASASYWYGFVCGFLAADGTVDTYGCTMLTQKAEATLKAIESQLPRIGMVAGPIRSQTTTKLTPAYKGQQNEYVSTMHYMTLLKQFMCVDDFLIPHHRENFERNHSASRYGKYIGVKSVEPTALTDDVYCCVEDETHTFVIDNGILTGNCYGNSFTSLIIPFRRNLSCKREGCGFEVPLKQIHGNPRFNFSWSGFKWKAKCPRCGTEGEWTHIDRRSGDEDAIKLRRWNPKEMELLWNPYTDDVDYVWKIPGYYRNDLRAGKDLHIMESAPWEVINCVKRQSNMLFSPSVLYHMKESTFAGVWNKGWGISRVLTNFRQAWYVQVLHRFNQAIGMDYIVPFRVICPEPKGGSVDSADPALGMDMMGFTSQMRSMLRTRQADPTAWHVSSYPIRYARMGGEANQLAPYQLMEQGMDTLLNSIGVPMEFYKGTMSLQAAPAGLRLIESTWSHLTHRINRFLQWLCKRISEVMSWDKITCTLERPSHVDDINRQLAKLQTSMAGLTSKGTGLGSIGLNYEEETRKKYEEQEIEAEIAQESQDRMEAKAIQKQLPEVMAQQQAAAGQADPGQAAAGQAGAAGAAPVQGGAAAAPMGAAPADAAMMGMGDPVAALLQMVPAPGQPVSPVELDEIASAIAQRGYGLQRTQRISLLRQLKAMNKAIHSLVKSAFEEMDRSMERQGLVQGQQQAQTQATQMAA